MDNGVSRCVFYSLLKDLHVASELSMSPWTVAMPAKAPLLRCFVGISAYRLAHFIMSCNKPLDTVSGESLSNRFWYALFISHHPAA